MANQIYTVIELSRGIRTEFTGTVAELQKRLEGTLRAGRRYDPRIKLVPKSIQELVNSLNLTAEKLLMAGRYSLAVV